MPSRNRKKRSKQRAEYLQKQDDILSQENKAKARARYKADPEKKKASVRQGRSRKEEGLCTRQLQGRSRKEEGLCTRQLQGRSRKELYATATTQILNLSNLLKGSDIKRTSRRTVLLKGSDIKRTSRRTVLLKGSDIERTSRRTVLLKGRNTRTIQLPLRHLKGIGIGMNPLSDWLNVLPRVSGIAGVTELPLPPKGMSWHVVLH